MKTMTSTEIKNHFGEFIETARREPVVLTQHGRKVLMAMPIEEAEELRALKERSAQQQPAAPAKRNALLDLIGKGRKYSSYKSDEEILEAIRAMREDRL
jgi:prevent-host-death family protein